MPVNKNALIRYKTIDNCLRNKYRRWTLEDLVEKCSEVLYEMEGIKKGVSVRTIQGDIQMMRSDKLGYNAPIEVYEQKYYRYSDKDYSITQMPLTQNDFELMQEAVDMLRELKDFKQFNAISDIVSRLQENLAITKHNKRPIIHFDNVKDLKGIELLNPLYNYISHKQTIKITYQSFSSNKLIEYILFPYLLKEFRNRWFIYGSRAEDMQLYNLALDRIITIEPIDIPFQENPSFDSEHFFDDIIGVSKDINDKPKEITFWASVEQSKYIKTKPIHTSQKVLNHNPDGSCVFSINVIENFELYSIFLSYGSSVKILSPKEIARRMKRKATELYDTYK
ncbi:MAG: WYL domain-containing protein [Bacteroidales bacterium]|jgi:predicted DNA-binding transcriptional regulator YafY|nr:WYL domain-containing protein [Bacteroidales bacterium]